ncbi:MAG: phosphorylase [Bacillota bacterium]|nr:phosphorylase [Bacillota bacterium]
MGEKQMKDLYLNMQASFQRYNDCTDMLQAIYGLDKDTLYDAIIVAPSWKPEKIFVNYKAEIKVMKQGPYFCGYEVTVGRQRFGYIQTSSCSGNIIDCCLALGNSVCDRVIFIGAVGSLKSEIKLGDIVVPKHCIAGDGGSLYLYDKITTENFRKHVYPDKELTRKVLEAAGDLNIKVEEKVVYCTDTIYCEYMHLNEILSLGSELIEMETAAFFRCMELIGKKGIALLCVSDNSAANNSLIGRTEEDTYTFHKAREAYIPQLILELSRREL